jgi:signal transduction histidine kinase
MAEPGETFFLRLFEATPHPYLILGADPAYPILAVNDRYLEATDTHREAIIGRGLFEIFPDNPEDGAGSSVSDLRTSLGRVMTDRKPDTMGVQKYDIPLRDGSGGFEVRYWSPVNTPVFDEAGELAWIIHHVEDVTAFILQKEKLAGVRAEEPERIHDGWERMEAEVMRRAAEVKEANRALKTAMEELERSRGELAALNERLNELDHLKSDFFANISHELRTPLTLILGPLGQRLREPGLDSALRSDLERMERNARILLARVNDLLDLAKLDAGRMGVRIEQVDLARLVCLEAARFESLAAVGGIAFTVEAPGPLSAQVDPEKVQRILAEDLGPRLTGANLDHLDKIVRASARMSDLIDGLLQLSRITRGELAREWVDLSAMAGLIRQELEAGDPARKVQWDLHGGLSAWGDRRLLEALLRNLLGNAWKFTSGTDAARIALHGETGGNHFQVSDNGAGFDMATVHRIVRRHGGIIEAQAEAGKGARFAFTLPGPEELLPPASALAPG